MRLTKILALGCAAVLLAGAALATARYVQAQEPDPQAAGNHERLDAFLDKVAAKLGVSTDELKQAFKDAGIETVDERIADGSFDAERGARIKEKIASGDSLGFGSLHPGHGKFGHGTGHPRLAKLRGAFIESAANAIGIDTAALATELRNGRSIADVAADHGVSLDAVKAAVLADAKTKLDQAVANGRVDQSRADEMLAKLGEKIDELLHKTKAQEQ